jgi:hypothetical protein
MARRVTIMLVIRRVSQGELNSRRSIAVVSIDLNAGGRTLPLERG